MTHSDHVKISLFRAHYTPLYTAPLRAKFEKARLHKLQVAFNDYVHILIKKQGAGVSTFQALLRNVNANLFVN